MSPTENPATDPNTPPDLGLDEVCVPCRYEDDELEVIDKFGTMICRLPLIHWSPRGDDRRRRGNHIAMVLSEWPHVIKALRVLYDHLWEGMPVDPNDGIEIGRLLERLGIK